MIGNGLVVDPAALIQEIETLEAAGIEVSRQLSISNRAHVIFPFHRMMEKMSEQRPGRTSIGTTSRGIGPCYEDKIARRGIRMADLLDRETFAAQYDALVEEKELIARALGYSRAMDFAGIRAQYEAYAERLRPHGVRYGAVDQRRDSAGQVGDVRGRAGDDARYRPRDVSVRDVVERGGGRAVHGDRACRRRRSTA